MGYPVGPNVRTSTTPIGSRASCSSSSARWMPTFRPKKPRRCAGEIQQNTSTFIPGGGHGMGGPYGRMNDFFLRHLLGKELRPRNAPCAGAWQWGAGVTQTPEKLLPRNSSRRLPVIEPSECHILIEDPGPRCHLWLPCSEYLLYKTHQGWIRAHLRRERASCPLSNSLCVHRHGQDAHAPLTDALL